MAFLAVFGWVVIAALTAWSWISTFAIFRCSLGFTGRVSGECYLILILSLALTGLSWFFWPFELSVKIAS